VKIREQIKNIFINILIFK